MLNEHMISENFEKLFNAAKEVRNNAHVPYSKFKVGAAFLTENNSIIAGCNVENAAYPQSQCAEASAIGNLIANGFTKIKEVVVIGSGDLLCSPCGGCRRRQPPHGEHNKSPEPITTTSFILVKPLAIRLPIALASAHCD